MEVIEVARRLKSNYVVNLRNGVVHRAPTTERCNMDQAKKRRYVVDYYVVKEGRRLCGWCFGGGPGSSDSRKPCP